MGGDADMIVAGIGFRKACSAAEIVAVLRQAEAAGRVSATVLATAEFKSGAAALREAALLVGLHVLAVPAEGLSAAEARCATKSERVRGHVGFGSIAEASALAAAGARSVLLVARIAGANATCALAEQGP